jgi:hypothetical protein
MCMVNIVALFMLFVNVYMSFLILSMKVPYAEATISYTTYVFQKKKTFALTKVFL